MKVFVFTIILILCTSVIVCYNHSTHTAQALDTVSLSVTEKIWQYESLENAKKRKPKTQIIESIKPNDIIYNKYGAELTVQSVSSNKVILNSNGVLTTDSSLLNEAPNQFILKRGSELVLKTKTLDAGSTIKIKYNK